MSPEVLAAVITSAIALFAAAIAVAWPSIQTNQRGRKFERIIRRELGEINPYPKHPDEKPWWEHATKRFVHEAMFRDLSQNRDFLLGLNPGVIYQVSQLWIALEKRDGIQWGHFLRELAKNKRISSAGLREACDQWENVLRKQRQGWLETMGAPSPFRQEAALARTPPLFEKRFEAYGGLLPLTEYGTEDQPKELDPDAKRELVGRLTEWFYKEGAGLLLSGRALEQFQITRSTIDKPGSAAIEIRHQLSQLRTDLKIDLGVRQPRERAIALAWPEDERW